MERSYPCVWGRAPPIPTVQAFDFRTQLEIGQQELAHARDTLGQTAAVRTLMRTEEYVAPRSSGAATARVLVLRPAGKDAALVPLTTLSINPLGNRFFEALF